MAEIMRTEKNVNAEALENEYQKKVEEISREETSNPSPLVVSLNEAAATATEECKDPDKESNPPQVVEEGEEPSPQVIEGAQETQPCQVTEAPEEPNSSTSPMQEPVLEVVSDQIPAIDDEGERHCPWPHHHRLPHQH